MATRLHLSLDEFYAHPDVEDHIAAYEIEQDRCHFHRGPRSECPDAERDWFPQRNICYVEMQHKAAERIYEHLHEDAKFHDGSFASWSKEFSTRTPYRYDDGVQIWMAEVDVQPWDDFLSNPSASPDPPTADPEG